MVFTDFILQHEGDDTARLLLSRGRYPGVDMDLAVNTIEVRRKLRTKVPEWYAVPSLRFPSRLSGEQCSSSETARYKAGMIDPCPPSKKAWRVADLTGGMGVDSWAFAGRAEAVLYNEMRPELAEAAAWNFKELGVKNITVQSREVMPGNVAAVLGDFGPDVIYLDPARRAEDGRKVFLIEDCRPDVLGILPELFTAARFVLLKLSPMADITMACRRLGHVREVHVVSADGECKELLLLLDREWEDGYTMTAYGSGRTLAWTPEEEAAAAVRLPDGVDAPFLFEPGKALLKAAAFNLPCSRYGLTKLGIHTHLYLATEIPVELRPFGKVYAVEEAVPLNNRSLKEMEKQYPRAEVTARNLPMTSETLRRKLGCTGGGEVHLFGVRIDRIDGSRENKILVTTPVRE